MSDYTQQVAQGLGAAGDLVEVWSSPCAKQPAGPSLIRLNRLPDHFGRRARAVMGDAFKKRQESTRILVQYVPHAFGSRAMNLPLCWWLYRNRCRNPIWVYFHEVAYPWNWRQSAKRNLLSATTALMASLLARAAEKIFISIPAWERMLKPLVPAKRTMTWLPVPCSVPNLHDGAGAAALKGRLAIPGGFLVGHFGTYGNSISQQLLALIPPLLASKYGVTILLMGRGSTALREQLIARHPNWGDRIHAIGEASAADISRHLNACDVMIQPYVDGVSSRRTTTMAGLAHGLPIVTNEGALSETLWSKSGAVMLAPAGDIRRMVTLTESLLSSKSERERIGAAGKGLYAERFDIKHVIRVLRESAENV